MFSFILILLAALASLLSLPVGGSDFRVTAGIIVLIAGLLLNRNLKPLPTGIMTGFAVCLMRVLATAISGGEMDVLSYFLEVFFYLGYVLVYILVVLKDDDVYTMPLVIGLSLSDFGGNSLEYFARLILGYESWQTTSLTTLLISALVRSVIIILVVYLARPIFVKLGKEPSDPLAQDAALLGLGRTSADNKK